jgi:hypothetical protein
MQDRHPLPDSKGQQARLLAIWQLVGAATMHRLCSLDGRRSRIGRLRLQHALASGLWPHSGLGDGGSARVVLLGRCAETTGGNSDVLLGRAIRAKGPQ